MSAARPTIAHMDAAPVRRRVAIFIAMTVLATSVFWWLSWLSATGRWQFGAPALRQLFVTGLMWCPGLAALLTCLVTGKPWSELGMALPSARYLGIGLGLPLVCIAVAYALLWTSGLAILDPTALADTARKKFSWPGATTAGAVALSFFVAASVGVLHELGRSLGEELGWRGFLVSELLRRHGLAITSLLSGLIWGAWHFPLMIPLGSDTPMPFALACFVASIVAISVVAAWLRWRSGSVWPAVLLHAAHNAVLYPFFDAMATPAGSAGAYAVGETGLALAVVTLSAAALLFAATRSTAPWSRPPPAAG